MQDPEHSTLNNNKILFVVATKSEIEPLLNFLNFTKQNGYLYKSEKADILVTGVGIVFTIFSLQKHLSAYKYRLVINTGIAGSFHKEIPLGEVLLISRDRFADIGIESNEGFQNLFETAFADKNAFPFTEGILAPKINLFLPLLNKLPVHNAITVNMVHGTEDSISLFSKKYKATAESMEGAAVFYVCMMLNTNVIQIRSISNYVEPRDTSTWKIKEAIINLNNYLIDFVSEWT